MTPYFNYYNPAVSSGDYLYNYYPFANAYSLRQLRSTSTQCIRVRRSSDNTEKDIGWSSDMIDVSALESFCSGTDGYVTTWYDQGGTNHLVQATAGTQPRIVSGGVTDSLAGIYAMYFANKKLNGSAIAGLATSNNYSYFTVSAAGAGSTLGTIFCTSTSTADRVVNFCDSRTTPTRNSIIQNSGATSYNLDMSTARNNTDARYLSAFVTSAKAYSCFDNGAAGSTGSYTGTYTNNTFQVGRQHGDATPLTGYIFEIIIYTSDQSSNRTSIESNISGYYAI